MPFFGRSFMIRLVKFECFLISYLNYKNYFNNYVFEFGKLVHQVFYRIGIFIVVYVCAVRIHSYLTDELFFTAYCNKILTMI